MPLEIVPDEIYTVLIELIKALSAFRFFASTFATLFTVEMLRIHSTVRELAFTKSAYTSNEDKFPVTTDDTDVYPALRTAVERVLMLIVSKLACEAVTRGPVAESIESVLVVVRDCAYKLSTVVVEELIVLAVNYLFVYTSPVMIVDP